VLEDTPAYRISGKTGSGIGSVNVGWFVGYLEQNSRVYFFATNIKGSSSEVNGPKAKEITYDVLQEFGLLGR
jgi:beta-lactamase class D